MPSGYHLQGKFASVKQEKERRKRNGNCDQHEDDHDWNSNQHASDLLSRLLFGFRRQQKNTLLDGATTSCFT